MTASLPETTPTEDAAAAAALGIEGAEAPPPEGEERDEESSDTLEDLPEWAQAEIREGRRKAAAAKVKAAEARIKEREARKAKTEGAGSTPTEADIAAAIERGREEARAEAGVELARSSVRAALTGIVPEDRLDETVDDLNIAVYVGEDHRPDTEAIKALRDRYTALLGTRKTTPKVSHGRQGAATSKSNAEQFGDVMAELLG